MTRRGQRSASDAFVVFVAPDGADGERAARRLGITVSRRVGNAVVRNRIKRGVREWFRHSRRGLRPGTDLVVIARRAAAALSGSEIAAALDDLTRAGGRVRS